MREFDRSPSPNSFSLLAQRASPHRSPNRPAKCVQLAGLKSIDLAQAKQAQDAMVSDRPKVIGMAIRDLDDYLVLFPDQVQAKAILGELSIKKGNCPRYNKSIISLSSS